MNSDQNVPKAKFTDHLKALLLGGVIAAAATQSASAASLPVVPAKEKALDARLDLVRQQMDVQANTNLKVGNGSQSSPDMMWWRNAWGNGGWHNWHNGWRNGGWGNFHNF